MSSEVKDVVIDWMTEYVTDGLTPLEAAAAAINRVKATGFSDQVLDIMGPTFFADFWRREMSSERRGALTLAGTRRVNVAALNDERSLFDVLCPVSRGVWKPFGDLTREDCSTLRGNYQRLIAHLKPYSELYQRLAKNLRKDQMIRQKYSEDEVRSIFRDFGVDPGTPPGLPGAI